MADALALLRLVAALLVAAGIVYAIYRALRWRFPRLGPRRAGLIVGLGVVILASMSASLLRTGNATCLQHENSVLLHGERVLRVGDERTARPAPPPGSEQYLRVVESCRLLVDQCPFDKMDDTDIRARATCAKALAGAPLG